MSPPWMPLYVADYLADTRRLSTLEHGAYMLLIMDYWRNGAAPDDDAILARIAGLTVEEWQCVRNALAMLFTVTDSKWTHKRIDSELRKSAEKSEKASNSASNRWKKGKNDAFAMPTQCEGNAKAMLSQPQSQGLASSSFHSEEAAAATAPEKISKEEIERRCEQAAGFGPLSGISKIAGLVDDGADFDGRVLPIIREASKALRKAGKRPDSWLYFAPAIRDPDRKPRASAIVPIQLEGFYAAAGTPQLEAWQDFKRRTTGKSPPLDAKGGWRFPSEFPPADEAAA